MFFLERNFVRLFRCWRNGLFWFMLRVGSRLCDHGDVCWALVPVCGLQFFWPQLRYGKGWMPISSIEKVTATSNSWRRIDLPQVGRWYKLLPPVIIWWFMAFLTRTKWSTLCCGWLFRGLLGLTFYMLAILCWSPYASCGKRHEGDKIQRSGKYSAVKV